VWNDRRIESVERKRMLRLLIEDATLVKSEKVSIHVRFRGGRTTSLTVDKPRSMALVRKTQPPVVTVIDGLLETCTDQQVATRLNELGYTNWQHQTFTARKVALVRTTMGCRVDLSDCARVVCSPAPNSPRSSRLAKPRSTNGDGKGFYDGTFTGMITGAYTNLWAMSCSSEVLVDAKQRGPSSLPLQLPDKVQCETYSLLCGLHTGVVSGFRPMSEANARVFSAM
jgi:hypothetical protein